MVLRSGVRDWKISYFSQKTTDSDVFRLKSSRDILLGSEMPNSQSQLSRELGYNFVQLMLSKILISGRKNKVQDDVMIKTLFRVLPAIPAIISDVQTLIQLKRRTCLHF